MTDLEIFNGIKKILVDEFEAPEERVTMDATLYDQLELDSLDSVDLIVALENAFGFKIDRVRDEETLRQMRSIQDIIRFIQSKIN
jgi:acyl carrier protein